MQSFISTLTHTLYLHPSLPHQVKLFDFVGRQSFIVDADFICYIILMSIVEIQKKLSPILRDYGIKRAAVFGSVSRGEDKPESDVDLLVDLGNQTMGMFEYMKFIEKLEQGLNRKVDLVTEKGLNKFLRPYILADLKIIYEDR